VPPNARVERWAAQLTGRWNWLLGIESLLPFPGFSESRDWIGICGQALHYSTKDKLVLYNRKRLRRQVVPGAYRTRNDDYFLLLVSIDIGKHDLLDKPVASANKPGREECSFVRSRGGFIEPHAEAANRPGFKIPLRHDYRLAGWVCELRNEALLRRRMSGRCE
jgi:hypothetical protein